MQNMKGRIFEYLLSALCLWFEGTIYGIVIERKQVWLFCFSQNRRWIVLHIEDLQKWREDGKDR